MVQHADSETDWEACDKVSEALHQRLKRELSLYDAEEEDSDCARKLASSPAPLPQERIVLHPPPQATTCTGAQALSSKATPLVMREVLGTGVRLFKKAKASVPVVFCPDRAAEELQVALHSTRFLSVHEVLERKRMRLSAVEDGVGTVKCAGNREGGAQPSLDTSHCDEHEQRNLEPLVVDGKALLDSLPRLRKMKELPKHQHGHVLEQRPFLPYEVRMAKLLGLP